VRVESSTLSRTGEDGLVRDGSGEGGRLTGLDTRWRRHLNRVDARVIEAALGPERVAV
jgi:hypothetical protein